VSSHIEVVSTASRYGADVRSFIAQLQAVVDMSARLKAVGDQIAISGDWDSLAANLGVSAADAESVYNLLGSVNGELHGAFTTQLLSRLG